MSIVEFHPSGKAHPRAAEFSLLCDLLQAAVRSSSDLAALAEQRVGIDVLDRLDTYGLKDKELIFIIPRSTLSYRRQHGERLSKTESDKAIRLVKILAQAQAVFGNQEKAMIWLRGQQTRFAGKTALELTATEHGARLVEDALVQIDEGIFA
ncbi:MULTISPECIES: antitoxin Xre/MbcA/ParS toxin-binding domain-containing protein [Burkholderia]|uniref:antitoxin Xre/MbcA/ParS toxin-binding domain-containing protein n=1 Tax=Burkholderia TaxID=32008 RepID=UPI00148E958C|nr:MULTISPECIES: antitoxin Xre/MbcA/ParS toxin-binding domain-containing protein [Burkholderia]QJW79336.1 DUF2384 domain-containing protein [Burkholderia glumae]